jgi:hypothetical protein
MSARASGHGRHELIAASLACLMVVLASCATSEGILRHASPPLSSGRSAPLFVHYYLWWDSAHWRSKLGPAYPIVARPAPLPARLASNGCAAVAAYPGATLIDVPATPPGLFTQDDPKVLALDVQQASAAHVDGFTVSWAGNGQPQQSATSVAFSRRLAGLIRAVSAHDAQPGARPFYLELGYEGLDNSRRPRSAAWAANDLAYFANAYASNPVFHVPAYGSKPVVMFLDSRKFSTSTLHAVLDPLRSKLILIGDEHGVAEWNRGISTVFDGDSWYWSDENPYTNTHAFATLELLSRTLHAQHKLWFSPLSAGYNKSGFGNGGACVPRNGIETLQRLYTGNAQSAPDGWMLISWNEFFENTYIEPSLRYGTTYLNALRDLHP